MSNMSYCRFQNTVQDLLDCRESLNEGDVLSEEEESAAVRLVAECIEIARVFTENIEEDDPSREKIRETLRLNYMDGTDPDNDD